MEKSEQNRSQSTSNRNQKIWRIDRDQLVGVSCILIGMCQAPFAFTFSESSIPVIAVGGGGVFLASIGVSLVINGGKIEFRVTNNKYLIGWVTAIVTAVYSASVFILVFSMVF